MAANLNNLTPVQQAMVNQIIQTGVSNGDNLEVIQAAVNIANAESDFNPLAQNPGSTAFGLFQYIDATWREKWSAFQVENPDGPLSILSSDAARENPDAQIALMYNDLNRLSDQFKFSVMWKSRKEAL